MGCLHPSPQWENNMQRRILWEGPLSVLEIFISLPWNEEKKAGAPLKAGRPFGPGGALKWGHSPAGPPVFPVHPGVSPEANFLQSLFPLRDWSLALFLQPFSSSSHQFLLAACRVSRWPKLRHKGSTGEGKYDPSRGRKLLPRNLMYCFTVGFAVVFEVVITGICFSVSMMGNFWVHCFTSGKVNMNIIFQLVFSAWTVLHKFSCVHCDDSNTAGVSRVCLKFGSS